MSVDLVRVASVAAAEVVRQVPDPGERLEAYYALLRAYDLARDVHARQSPVTEYTIKMLGGVIAPSNGGQWRRTPVTFANGGGAVAAGLVPGLMSGLITYGNALTPTEWVKEFLDIHPFTDGNGRTAWLLCNLLAGTLDVPDPLPDLYGEQEHVTPA